MPTSASLFTDALSIFPGGVNSPARAFRAVGGIPRFITSASGAYLTDADNRRYIDYVLSFGPNLLGHAHPALIAAVQEAVTRGFSYGAPTELETRLARLIQSFMPSLERLRFVNSGTEATMSALRLARAYTKRDLIVKFDGQYHGHADFLLVHAGSGVATLGLPDSPGVPAAAARGTLVAPFNDIGALEQIFHAYPDQIAAVIVEPVAGNMGVVLPREGYLQSLRDLTQRHGTLLIFDEVMTGFRAHPSGAQTLYNVTPDITTLGKVIGGGLPVGAYGGRADIMQRIAPEGDVYQAGTMSGNPVVMAAGIALLTELQSSSTLWPSIAQHTTTLATAIQAEAHAAGIPVQVPHVGTMLSVFFSETPVTDWKSVAATRRELFVPFFHSMLESGVYLPPSPFESWFLSSAHGDAELDATVSAIRKAFATLKESALKA